MTSASAFSFAPGGGNLASPATCGIYIKQSVLKIGQETTETKTTQSNKRQVIQDSEKPVGLPNNTTVPYNAKKPYHYVVHVRKFLLAAIDNQT